MKKRYRYILLSLTVLTVLTGLTGCAGMIKGIDKLLLKIQIKDFETMKVDETAAARFVGTWRTVNVVRGVRVMSLSSDGSMAFAERKFTGGTPDKFASRSYKVSKDTFARRLYAGDNPDYPDGVVFFNNYQFNDDYSEVTFDFNGLGMEYGWVFTKIDDKYTDTISAASLGVPGNASQSAGLTFAHVWSQPLLLARENEFAAWTARFHVISIKINGREFGFVSPFDLPEGEYEVYFKGTIGFRKGRLDSTLRTLDLDETFRTTLRKGHIYEVKVYLEPQGMNKILTLGPDVYSSLGTAVRLTEISPEQYYKEY
jgi:hypothetical protein